MQMLLGGHNPNGNVFRKFGTNNDTNAELTNPGQQEVKLLVKLKSQSCSVHTVEQEGSANDPNKDQSPSRLEKEEAYANL